MGLALSTLARLLWRVPYFRGRDRLIAALLQRAQQPTVAVPEDVIDGLRLTLDFNDHLSRSFWLIRQLPPSIRIVEAICRSGDVVVDVGANMGYLSIAAARKVGSGGRVIAIEPGSRAFDLLQRNLTLNCASGVTALKVACGERDESVSLFASDFSYDRSSLASEALPPGGWHEEAIRMVPLARLLSGLGVEADVVKIDVEGAEWAVLRGLAASTVRKPRCMLVELSATNAEAFGYKPSAMCRWLRSHGYALRLVRSSVDDAELPYSDGLDA